MSDKASHKVNQFSRGREEETDRERERVRREEKTGREFAGIELWAECLKVQLNFWAQAIVINY